MKGRVGSVPVYLRDLSDQLQKEFTARYYGRKKLLHAIADGKDIIVGYYCQESDVEAVI